MLDRILLLLPDWNNFYRLSWKSWVLHIIPTFKNNLKTLIGSNLKYYVDLIKHTAQFCNLASRRLYHLSILDRDKSNQRNTKVFGMSPLTWKIPPLDRYPHWRRAKAKISAEEMLKLHRKRREDDKLFSINSPRRNDNDEQVSSLIWRNNKQMKIFVLITLFLYIFGWWNIF